MKKSVLVLAVGTIFMGSLVTSCSTPAEKVENAQENVVEANEKLDDANEDYLTDVAAYRMETADKIAANEKSLAEFKLRIASEKQEAREDYNKKLAELEQKNADMKKKLDDYKADGKENWEKFKVEYNHDMDGLGNAFRDVTVKNSK